jgi:hypothetical protein
LFTLGLVTVSTSLLLARAAGGLHRTSFTPPRSASIAVRRDTSQLLQQVWQVEQTAASETYSNGLRIDTRFAVPNHRRSYAVFSADGATGVAGPRRTEPAGIVFHTTESLQIPFEAGQNSRLKLLGESVLDFVARERAYNFLIDRFGRVYRVVPEADAANHAGDSVWSDGQRVYVNLNESFLGVSFEAHTSRGKSGAGVSPAQVRAAAMLTEMLRSRYGIAARNCVTHAQVSVNPGNMLAGYHTDWASGFPFEQLGLPNNYALPLAAIAVFGFQYDPYFAGLAETSMNQGIELAEHTLRSWAAGSQVGFAAFRKALQMKYRQQRDAAHRQAFDTDLETRAAE